MGLTLKHIVSTKAGTFHYRRRIPKDAAEVIGKREFKRLLGQTEREALRNYPKVNAEFERVVEDARKAARSVTDLTPLEIHRLAKRRASELEALKVYIGSRELTGADPEAADLIRDSVLSKGVPDPVERQAVNLMANKGRIPRPSPTLADAKRLYLHERITGDINEKQKALRLERVMGYLAHAIESDRPLDRLTREDAREVRDHMLRDLDMKPSTVRRYVNDIRAVIGFGITEFGLRDALNPFQRLEIRLQTVAREERSPIPGKTLNAIRTRLEAHAGADLWQIWRILEGTGCRLGEVTGLLVSDVKLEAPVPYLDLVHHAHRRLKTAGSVRRVPLVGEALEAAKEAVTAAGNGTVLFPRYGKVRGADVASASLMKHIRSVTQDTKIVVHSLRHTMKDRMISARVPDSDQDLVLGHSRGGMGERYGGADTRLEVALKAVKVALDLAANIRVRTS
ncbi:site-specific integrase [Agrobacterium sp. CMT1]|uniref:site-specific integrase n=1 Tax=Agrobacterium sp. CMT1 TaxID=3128901 RepID=UPI003077C9C9